MGAESEMTAGDPDALLLPYLYGQASQPSGLPVADADEIVVDEDDQVSQPLVLAVVDTERRSVDEEEVATSFNQLVAVVSTAELSLVSIRECCTSYQVL